MRREFKKVIANAFAEAVLESTSAEKMMLLFNGAFSLDDVFEGSDDWSFIERVFRRVRSGYGEEIIEFLTPFVPQALAKDIGAKKVTITW